jgi:hypothetical protein
MGTPSHVRYNRTCEYLPLDLQMSKFDNSGHRFSGGQLLPYTAKRTENSANRSSTNRSLRGTADWATNIAGKAQWETSPPHENCMPVRKLKGSPG